MKFFLVFILIFGIHCAGTRHGHAQISSNEIYFRFDSDRILSKYSDQLKSVLKFLQKNPDSTVTIEGHTDFLGEEDYNLGLGDRRARAIKAYFIKNGVQNDRIVTVTYGESQPKFKTAIRKNRRALIKDVAE